MNNSLSLIQQTGQMIVAGFEGTSLSAEVESLVRNRGIGGLILFERNYRDPEQLSGLISDLQELAGGLETAVPLFISVDQEGGRVSRLGKPFTSFPEPAVLGAARSETLARRYGEALGRELNSVGINMDYAPVLDVNSNPDNPIIGRRAFSDSPDWAGRLGVAFMEGMRSAGVIPVGKHFPGHGDTVMDSHLELPSVDRKSTSLEQVELPPFITAIHNRLDVLMTAHVMYPAWDEKLPATFSPEILGNILRQRLGFTGLVISDDLEMKAIEDHFELDSIPALGIHAGINLFLICHNREKVERLQDKMIADLETGRIPIPAVEDSVRKILALKQTLVRPNPDGPDLITLAEEHRQLVGELQDFLA